MKSLNLYEIQKEYRSLIDEVENLEGELSPDLDKRLSINRDNLQKKTEAYALVYQEKKSSIEVIDSQIERLSKYKKQFQDTCDLLKNRVEQAMLMYEIETIESDLFRASFRNSKAIEITGEVPIELCKEKTTITPDKALIKKKILAGEVVIGAKLVTRKNFQFK